MMWRLVAFILAILVAMAGCGGGQSAAVLPEAHASASDDTTALQADLDAACNTGRLHLAAKVYRTSAPLVVRCPLHLSGEGVRSTFIISSADEALVIAPEAPISQGYFTYLHDFSIWSATPGAGRAALVARLKAGVFLSNFTFARLNLGDFGGPTLVLDNSVGNANGFFRGVIEQCWVNNDMRLVLVGDTITIRDNTITTSLSARNVTKAGWPGIDATTVGGSRKLVISHNNITASGGAIHLRGVVGPEIVSNIFEHPVYYGMPYAGAAGFLQLTDVAQARVVGNMVNNVGGAKYGIAFDGG